MNIKQLTAAAYNPSLSAPKPTNQKAAPETEGKSIKVALSAGIQSLSESENDIDMARVHAIREALANGTLTINPERIAQGLIDSAKELL